MKKLSLYLVFLLLPAILPAQKNISLGPEDVFVLQVSFKENVLSGVCPCDPAATCVLGEMESLKVVYAPSIKNFDSATIAKDIRHFVLPREHKFEKGKTYMITANLSGSKFYLAYTRTLDLKDEEEVTFSRNAGQKIKAKLCKANKEFERAVKSIITEI